MSRYIISKCVIIWWQPTTQLHIGSIEPHLCTIYTVCVCVCVCVRACVCVHVHVCVCACVRRGVGGEEEWFDECSCIFQVIVIPLLVLQYSF